MKTITFISIALFLVFSETSIQWTNETEHDFGDIEQGIPKTHLFNFKNTLDEPLMIETIRTTCGCTVPEWSDEPVLPDSTGTIKVVYDAQKEGYFHKKIRVFFVQQQKAEHLFIEGFVD